MPLVQIDLDSDVNERLHRQISDEVHQAQIDALGIPADDKFQLFRPHPAGEIEFDPTYGGVDRQSLMVIQLLMVHRYPVAVKRALYRAIVERLGALGIRGEDVQIAIVENGYEDWYAGTLS